MMIFDGKAFAQEMEATLRIRLRSGVQVPKIVSILVGEDPASQLYTRLKKEAAQRVGIEFEVVKIEDSRSKETVISQIREASEDPTVTGVMVQLPLLRQGFGGQAIYIKGEELEHILSAIPLHKDVDGLRFEESGVMPATVRAILSICESIANNQFPIINNQNTETEFWQKKFVVLGARGAVGRPLVHFLKQRGVEVGEVEWDTPDPFALVASGEVVISCVGKAGLLTGEMVQTGVVAVDVGMSTVSVSQSHSDTVTQRQPLLHEGKDGHDRDTVTQRQPLLHEGKDGYDRDTVTQRQPLLYEGKDGHDRDTVTQRVVGDMTQEVYQKASVAVPVPGGVGPVTIASLLMNGVELCRELSQNTT